MEVYIRETQEVMKRFLAHGITFPGCIAALDSALAALVPQLKPNQLPGLRAVMLANNELVMKEMAKREAKRRTDTKHKAKKRSNAQV